MEQMPEHTFAKAKTKPKQRIKRTLIRYRLNIATQNGKIPIPEYLKQWITVGGPKPTK